MAGSETGDSLKESGALDRGKKKKRIFLLLFGDLSKQTCGEVFLEP